MFRMHCFINPLSVNDTKINLLHRFLITLAPHAKRGLNETQIGIPKP